MVVYKTLNEMRAVTGGKVGYYKLEETKAKTYLKLYDLVKSPQTKIIRTSERTYQYLTLSPGKHYKLPDDFVLTEIIEKFKEKKKYSTKLKETLTEAGMDFEEVVCKTCGGRVKKIEYKTVEVVHGTYQRKGKENDPPEDSEETV